MGPEALAQYVNPTEFLKRLAAASGIDYLNLIKSPETMAEESEQAKQDQMQQQLMSQAGQLAKSPIAEQLLNGQQEQAIPSAAEARKADGTFKGDIPGTKQNEAWNLPISLPKLRKRRKSM